MEKEKYIWDSYDHLCWYLYADLRVLPTPVQKRMAFNLLAQFPHPHLLLPTWTLALETMMTYFTVLTNEGLVTQRPLSHDMKRENALSLLHVHKYSQLLEYLLCLVKCSIKVTCKFQGPGAGRTRVQLLFYPDHLFTLALISSWDEHFKQKDCDSLVSDLLQK